MKQITSSSGARDETVSRPSVFSTGHLPPREAQVLERLLAGDAEKQIARTMGISQHTAHVYVKSLYRRFNVESRGELMALAFTNR